MPNRGTKPAERCTDKQLQCITLMILWRYDPHKGMAELADTVGVARQTLYKWKARDYFKDEYEKQLRMYKENFEEIQLADRKERVKALSLLFEQVPEYVPLHPVLLGITNWAMLHMSALIVGTQHPPLHEIGVYGHSLLGCD